jgi:hypothetical protein
VANLKSNHKQVIKSTGGMSVTPFAGKAPAGRAITGSSAAVNRDSIKGNSQVAKKYLRPSGSKAKRKAQRAMPNSPGMY